MLPLLEKVISSHNYFVKYILNFQCILTLPRSVVSRDSFIFIMWQLRTVKFQFIFFSLSMIKFQFNVSNAILCNIVAKADNRSFFLPLNNVTNCTQRYV